MQQLGVEEQRLSLGADFLPCVGLSTYLPRCDTHQCVLLQVVGGESVGQLLEQFVGDEHGIDIVVVERVPAVLQLIIVNNSDEPMQLGCTDVTDIVVDVVYLENLLHSGRKDTKKMANL